MRRGFTLAEVLIAILFVSIALFGYVGLHIRLLYSGEKIQDREDHREQACCTMVDSLSQASTEPTKFPDVPGGPPGLKQVTTTVKWDDRNGPRTLQVETWAREVRWGW